MREYLRAAGIPVAYDDRTMEEILNGRCGPGHGTDKVYSSDPDYASVDPELFKHLDALQSRVEYEASR